MTARLLIIGGGKMGSALLSGLVGAKWAEPDELAVAEAVAERRSELAELHPGVKVVDAPVRAEGVVLAVKPNDVREVSDLVVADRVLSIVAGVRLAKLQAWLGAGVPVVRAMPNTPALVGAGAAAIAAGNAATDDDLAWAEEILGAVGTVVRVPEPLLDAVTGLSGSGPAYVFLVVESLIEAGVLCGLPRPVSEQLAIQTVFGAARLLVDGMGTPEELRAAVTSPGGTTAAGLRILEDRAVRAAFLEAVAAASERSAELGGA